ncbi:HPr kinase/phosphatase C-terminal domain-containing protein [Sulfitobacter sp. W027]|jgi:HPr kinase/phosphorylase|uniref:HPr kinase/phosphorylase n=1 Tax=Sulfitobacter sp. W027 TaxID=2867025 RepID=UPI0021A7B41D|nr:HPr kinase/phosphatase C-terminal domain-containing protein [Sulfitobacter sp. W027]UWR33236.1 HPr kinase/phosphatase C-terminal domain-containing protein [Sulfitobacter sp. W027]
MTIERINLHASCVAINGRGVLILGPSGAGKSALALQLIALGATLVADDRTDVIRHADQVIASVPENIRGLIEARYVGILRVKDYGPVPLALVIDLAHTEKQRLPERHTYPVQGVTLPCFHKCDSAHFPAAIHLYISGVKEPN